MSEVPLYRAGGRPGRSHQPCTGVPETGYTGRPLVRSHEERRWLFEEPTQSRTSPCILQYTKIIGGWWEAWEKPAGDGEPPTRATTEARPNI